MTNSQHHNEDEENCLAELAQGIETYRCPCCGTPIEVEAGRAEDEIKCLECGAYLDESKRDVETYAFSAEARIYELDIRKQER